MTKLTKEKIKDELRDKIYCVVDPDGDEIVTLDQCADEILALRKEVEEYKLKFEGKDLVWFERDEVQSLDPNHTGIVSLAEVKVKAASDAWDAALDAYARLRGVPILEDELAIAKEQHAAKIKEDVNHGTY